MPKTQLGEKCGEILAKHLADFSPSIWEPIGHLQGSLGPSAPETPKKSEKKSPGASGPGTPRESGKSLEKVPKDFFETFSRLSGGPGAGGPGRLFSDFLGVSGPEGMRDPCKWPTGSQASISRKSGRKKFHEKSSTNSTSHKTHRVLQGRHRGGRNFTSFLRFSGPFFHAGK